MKNIINSNKIRTLVMTGIVLILSGCAALEKDKDLDAQNEEIERSKREFLDRTNSSNKNLFTEKTEQSPRRQLIQFTYGPKTLNNKEFLEYLVATNAVLPSDLLDEIQRYEDDYVRKLKRANGTERIDIASNLEDLNKKVDLYSKLSRYRKLNFSSTQLTPALNQLTKGAGIRVNTEGNLNIKLSGRYSGSIASIIDSIAYENGLSIRVANNYSALTLTKNRISKSESLDLAFRDAIKDINNDTLQVKRYLAERRPSNLTSKIEISGLKSSLVQEFISAYNKKSRANLIVVKQHKESSNMRKILISRSMVEVKNEDITPTIAIYDPSINNGMESVIEKFSVYNDTPASMKERLEKYPMFSCGTSSPVPPEENGAGASTSDQTSGIDQALSQPSDITESTSTLAPVKQATESGCVQFADDKSGIVATGSITDVKLIEKLLVSQDTPVRQAMIEAYILEVSTDWKTTLESKLSQTRTNDNGYPGLFTFATGLLNIATADALDLGGVTVGTGNPGELQYLVNFIEANKIGKKVSNPVILVKDGETGVVEQTRTFRYFDNTTVTNANTNETTTSLKETQAPIVLEITPDINEHNDDIDLTFSYTSESYDSQEAVSASTSNIITSKLKVKPGQIIMMAGLFQETKSNTEQGIPGLSGLIKTPLKYLFGMGGKTDSIVGSELLVFLNPMVITNKNMATTTMRNRNNEK